MPGNVKIAMSLWENNGLGGMVETMGGCRREMDGGQFFLAELIW